MQITLTKEQVKEAFGELRFMGADNCYRYDKDSKKKTEEVEVETAWIFAWKQWNFQRLSLMLWWNWKNQFMLLMCREGISLY